MERVRGAGPTKFAAVLLAIGGVLNGMSGIAALWNSSFFVGGAHPMFGWGWVSLILGILKLVAALSIFQSGVFGRHRRRAGGG